MKIENETLFVTGAAGGLGRHFVHQALERGARRVYAATRSASEWGDARVTPIHLDVTSEREIADVAASASDTTILINNAGITGAPSLLSSPLDDIRATFETNVFAPLQLTRAFAGALKSNGGGAVVNVHSVLSWLAQPGAYSPSKAAVWGLTNSLRLELAAQGTLVVGAHLAYADTPMTARLDNISKADPADIVTGILDALEAGQEEAIVDETSRRVQAGLAHLTTGAVRS